MTTRIIFVLGMHRSGTSAVTRLINLLGAGLGQNLLQPMEGVNAEGFWENSVIVEENEWILKSLGSQWYDVRYREKPKLQGSDVQGRIQNIIRSEFSGEMLVAIKDPRLPRLLPIWLDALDHLAPSPITSSVLIVRDPLEVVRSLQSRDELPRSAGFLLWIDHVLKAELFSRSRPRIIFLYDQMLSGLDGSVRSLAEFLGLSWPIEEKVSEAIFAEINPRHRHQVVEEWQPSNDLEALALRLFHCYRSASPEEPDQSQLDDIRNQFSQLCMQNSYGLDMAHENLALFVKGRQRESTLGQELEYAQKIVEERDLQLEYAQKIVEERGRQLEYAQKIVEERDQQLKALNDRLVQIGQQHSYAIETVEARDSQIKALQSRLQELGEAHGYAIGVVEERDKQLSEMSRHLSENNELISNQRMALDSINSHWLLGRLVKHLKISENAHS